MAEFDLDHAGVVMPDLQAGFAAYARMGFRLTPRSLHAGARSAGGPVEPWGSGNHCAMLGGGYLEVLGLTDPALYSSAREMLQRYEGLHIVAFGCPDADLAHAGLHAAGVAVQAPRALERDAAFGPDGNQTRRARFRNVYVDRDRHPEARFIVIEHLTRDVLWQPHLLEHPNGALALGEVWFCAEDPATTAAHIAMVCAAPARACAPGHLRIDLRRGALHVVAPRKWASIGPGGATPPLPSPVGLGVQVRSLDAAAGLLARNGVPVCARDGLWVRPAHACGAAVRFY